MFRGYETDRLCTYFDKRHYHGAMEVICNNQLVDLWQLNYFKRLFTAIFGDFFNLFWCHVVLAKCNFFSWALCFTVCLIECTAYITFHFSKLAKKNRTQMYPHSHINGQVHMCARAHTHLHAEMTHALNTETHTHTRTEIIQLTSNLISLLCVWTISYTWHPHVSRSSLDFGYAASLCKDVWISKWKVYCNKEQVQVFE